MKNIVQRKWINQPSTKQPCHKWHGMNVLAVTDSTTTLTEIYFISGNIISAIIHPNCLSEGWK